MKIFLINLDTDTQRRQRMTGRLAELGLSWQRLPAVDGDRLTPADEALVDRQAQQALAYVVSAPEIGCWLSHREAHRRIADGADEMALILEDDLEIHDDLPEVLAHIESGVLGDFDVIRLHRARLHRRLKFTPCRRLDAKYRIGLVRPVDLGTWAYVMTRRAARHFIDRVPRMAAVVDRALAEERTHDLVVCSIDPPVVLHDDASHSSIEARGGYARDPGAARPRRWLRKRWGLVRSRYDRWLIFVRSRRIAKTETLSGLARPRRSPRKAA